MNIKEIRENLDRADVIKILQHFHIDPVREDGHMVVFPTVCHNSIEDHPSAKLYFYDNSHLFTCYTECDGSFDIIQLVQNIHEHSYHEEISLFEAISQIQEIVSRDFSVTAAPRAKHNEGLNIAQFTKTREPVIAKIYNDTVLEVFDYRNINEIFDFFGETFSKEVLAEYEIGYYLNKNCLTFPWRDADGKLVSIKGRFLDWTPDSGKAKYMPLTVGNIIHKNPISIMLYGIHQNQEHIRASRRVFLFEGEKSVLKLADASAHQLSGLAVGGQNLHPWQIKQLLNMNVNDVTICFDKDFDHSEKNKRTQTLNLIIKKAQQLTPFFNVSVMFDKTNLLNKKDSPIDSGYDNFVKLFKNKITL